MPRILGGRIMSLRRERHVPRDILWDREELFHHVGHP